MGKGLDISVTELREATDRFEKLRNRLSNDAWRARPAAGAWSPIECIAHLNITNQWYVEHLSKMTEKLHPEKEAERMNLMGWLVWRSQRSAGKLSKAKTTTSFVPPSDLNVESVLSQFSGLQDQLLTLIQRVGHLPISKVQMTSPFNEKVKYNLYSGIRILTVHELRHLTQAENAVSSLSK